MLFCMMFFCVVSASTTTKKGKSIVNGMLNGAEP